jgi:hypothetical protein
VIVSAQVIVGSLNDWQKERQFKVLNEKKEERGVKVIRDGVEQVIDIKVPAHLPPNKIAFADSEAYIYSKWL